jgi:hypothetical protein
VSLSVIVGVLVITTVASLLKVRRDPEVAAATVVPRKVDDRSAVHDTAGETPGVRRDRPAPVPGTPRPDPYRA